jgi:predicted metalloprotease with PDZ domain
MLSYQIQIPQPATHEIVVTLRLKHPATTQGTLLAMATWTPGSYLQREYAQFVSQVRAVDAHGKALKIQKTAKNRWYLAHSAEDGIVSVSYKVYAYRWTVRNAYLDEQQLFFVPSAVLMFCPDQLAWPIHLELHLPSGWAAHVPLPSLPTASQGGEERGTAANWTDNTQPCVYQAPDWDTMADSPIWATKGLKNFDFEASGLMHRVAYWGKKQLDEQRLSQDLQAIVEACMAIFEEHTHPCQGYLDNTYYFQVYFSAKGFGGLEHLNSTTLQFPKALYATPQGYIEFLELAAHEYFHLWNVKRLRPLQSFDYERENYTSLLWVAEGFTVYYEALILHRAGLIDAQKCFRVMAALLEKVENLPGNQVQPVAEASWDTWIKFYRPHEHSDSLTISYYHKGALVAWALDAEIIHLSQGRYTTDDLLRQLYRRCYQQADRAYTDADICAVLANLTGQPAAYFEEWLARYVYDTSTIPYTAMAEKLGLQLLEKAKNPDKTYAGWQVNGQGVITQVRQGSPAQRAGLQVDDVLLSLNEQPVKQWDKALENYPVEVPISVQFRRDGYLQTRNLTPKADPTRAWEIAPLQAPNPQQSLALKAWLRQ